MLGEEKIESSKMLKAEKTEKRQKTKGEKKQQGQQLETTKIIVDINATVSIITLKVNGLNTTIERQILSEWIKKQHPIMYCL